MEVLTMTIFAIKKRVCFKNKPFVNHIQGFSNFNMIEEFVKLQKILQLAEEMNNSNVYRNEAYEHGRKRRK